MTRYYPDTHDQTVKHLFQCGMTDEQIGERMGFGWQTIRRAREKLELGAPPKPHRTGNPAEIPPKSFDLNNPMVVAIQTLGGRLTEVNGAYRLDNTPTKFFEPMRETNRVLAEKGQEQVGPNDWRVP